MIEIDELEDRVVIRPDFDIVASRASEIRDAVLKMAAPGKTVILDLNRATIIDSMGIGVVVACLKTVMQLGGRFQVKTSNPDILKLFKLLQLEYILAPA
ncbi:MAG: STAS domain-containing protein [Thermodesulfobacteriota bacterium]